MQHYEERTVSITDMIGLLFGGWKTIILVAVLVTALMLLLAFVMRPVYSARVLFAPVEDSSAAANLGAVASQFGGLASLAGIDLSAANSAKEEYLAVLRSRRFSTEFIRDNNLKPILFADDWDAENNRWLATDVAEQPTDFDAFTLFDEEVRSVTEDRGSGLLTLEILWHDPVLAADWANELVRRANDVIREEAIEEARLSVEYLERELENTSVVELRNGLFQLIEQQTSTIMLANVRDEYAFKVLDPAVAADADDFVKPRRPLMVIGGAFMGFVLGIALVILMRALRTFRRQAA